jgi:hypothetical protein
MKSTIKLLAFFYAFLFSGMAHAGPILDIPILGGDLLVASDGNVHIEFLGSDAGYFNPCTWETRRYSISPAP